MSILTRVTVVVVAVASLAMSGCSDHSRQASAEPIPYTLDYCVVGGEKLGSMGPVQSEVYDGHVVKFCCPECKSKFDKMPTKHMEKLKSEQTVRPEPNG